MCACPRWSHRVRQASRFCFLPYPTESSRRESDGARVLREFSQSLLLHPPVRRIHHPRRRRTLRPHPHQCRCLRSLHRFHRQVRPHPHPRQNRRRYFLPRLRSRRIPLPRRLRFLLPRIPPRRGGARPGSGARSTTRPTVRRGELGRQGSQVIEHGRAWKQSSGQGIFGVSSRYSRVFAMASPRLGESEAIRGQSHSPSQRDASLSSIEISGLRPVAAGVVRGSGNFLEIAPEVPRAVRFLDWSASWCCRLEKTLFWSRSVDHDRPPNRTAMVWCTRMSALPWELTINRGEHVARSRRIVRQPRAGELCPEPLRRDNTAVCREPIQMDPRRSTATGNPSRSTEPPVIRPTRS